MHKCVLFTHTNTCVACNLVSKRVLVDEGGAEGRERGGGLKERRHREGESRVREGLDRREGGEWLACLAGSVTVVFIYIFFFFFYFFTFFMKN